MVGEIFLIVQHILQPGFVHPSQNPKHVIILTVFGWHRPKQPTHDMEASILYQTHQGTTKKLHFQPFSQNNSPQNWSPEMRKIILTPMFFTRSALDPSHDFRSDSKHHKRPPFLDQKRRSRKVFGGAPNIRAWV